jgi:Fe-S-cluster containining protein
MTSLPPKTSKHQELMKSVDDFLKDKDNSSLPSLENGRMEFQLYKAALVMDTFLSRLEEVIEETKVKATEGGMPVTCSKGCDACCSQPISSSFFEAVLIKSYLEVNPPVKEQFLARYDAWRSRIGDTKEYDQILQSAIRALVDGSKDVSDYVRNAVDHFNQSEKINCPFLEEHSCSIYPVRPVTCRQLLSIDDPVKCQIGEQARLLRAGDIDELTYRKLPILLMHLGRSFGFQGIVNSVLPITTYELMKHGEKYVDQVIRDCAVQMKNY